MEYAEKLKDPLWQRKRLEIFDRDKWTCQSCGDSSSTLHIHHLKYFPVDPWDYENYYLITYCHKCHESEHLIGEVVRENLSEVIDAKKIYFRPLAQLTVLIEDYPPFHGRLKTFLNEMMAEFLKSKQMNTEYAQ